MQTQFDHEKLDVYKLELQFIAWLAPLLDEVAQRPRTANVCDQIDRASLSALLNTAERNGKRQRPTRAKFLMMRAALLLNVLRAWMRWWPSELVRQTESLKVRNCLFVLFPSSRSL
jgi:hypothetical protein